MVPYLSAVGVGTIAFWTIGLVRVLLSGPSANPGAPLSGLFVLIPLTFVVALLTTVVPFIVLRAVALVFSVRCWVYFVVCGIFLGVAETAMLVTPHWLDWQAWARYSSVGQNFALSGALGGLVYWWMAVRKPALDGGGHSRQE
jgi:glucan phosphoethanolaminetransferase (alkaline phosphatase superfamily)